MRRKRAEVTPVSRFYSRCEVRGVENMDTASAVPLDLSTILSQTELDIIVGQYDPVVVGKLLSAGLANQHQVIRPYLSGIGDSLYPEFDPSPHANPLSAANRERCLVALLASRSRRLELAIHSYMALANGVAPGELAQIILAAGVYTGVDTVASAFDTLQTTLQNLKDLVMAKTADPGKVLAKLAEAFSK
jgi:carboxymuconolactone decarboxylase family protein